LKELKRLILLPLKNKLADLLRRPELDYDTLAENENRPDLSFAVREYEGYIKRQMQQVEQFKKLEERKAEA